MYSTEGRYYMKISKELAKGTTAMLVLSVLSEREMYGYEITGVISGRSEGVFEMKEGTLYPILHSLEKEGMLTSYRAESAQGRERRYYKITPTGLMHLKLKRSEWSTYSEAVERVMEEAT